MDADSPQEITLSELGRDFFLLGQQIRAGHLELPDCQILQRRVLGLFETLKNKARHSGLLSNEIEDVRYALAAYLDEMIQFSDWPGKDEWAARPLQAVLFGESHAGAKFFQRLQQARKSSSAVLEIYYTCLALGFMGEYHLGSPQELEELIDELRRDLSRGSGKTISVHGKRPESVQLGGKTLPLIPISAILLLLALILTVVLYMVLSSSQSSAVEIVQQMGRS